MPVPFADAGTKNTIPVASQTGITPGAASFTTGFPPLTFTPVAAGGIPPFGADFNGIYNAITQAVRWANAGGQYVYDSQFATAVGGYPKGALIQRSTLDGFWLNTTEGNSTNPDTGGGGWVDALAGRLIAIRTFNAPGTTTYTPDARAKKLRVITIGGGGGGGGCGMSTTGNATGGGGGASGSYIESNLIDVPSSPVAVTIGSGGAGGVGVSNGIDGGTTSFGALISCHGGAPGGGGAGGAGRTPGGGLVTLPTATISTVILSAGTAGMPGLSYGNTTQQSAIVVGGGGGSTPYGSGANWQLASSNGVPILSGLGNAGGGGGGAASSGAGAANGSAGAPGAVYIYEYA
jgi:hypothetical protein